MGWEKCLTEIAKAADGKLSDDDMAAILDDILRRKERNKNPRFSDAEKMKRAAEQVAQQYTEAQKIRRRNALMNETKRIGRRGFYEGASRPDVGLEAKIFGVNAAFQGSRLSTAARYHGLQRELVNGAQVELDQAGLGELFASRQMEEDWTDELFELNSRDGKPGKTKNKQALGIAQVLHRYQRLAIEGLNREGGWIRDYNGYVTRTSHDPDLIRRMGRDAWVQLVLNHVDLERSFGDAESAARSLPQMYASFVNGDHLKFDETLEVIANPHGSTAKRVSANRELHFKSAAAWRAYNAVAGAMTPVETIYRGLDNAARMTALMMDWGTSPRGALETDIAFLKDKFSEDQPRRDKLDKRDKWLNTAFGYLDGEANRPVNRLSANITHYWMAGQRLAKLGSAPVAAILDIATKASELRYQGVGFLERWGSMLSGYRGKSMRSGADREVLQLLRAGLEGRIGQIAARFEGADTAPGMLSRIENGFFKWTGLTGMTVNQRMDSELIMARQLGLQSSKDFAGMKAESQRLLNLFDISDRDWEMLRSVDMTQANGRRYLTPDIAKQIDKAKVYQHLLETGGNPSPDSISRYADDLSLKLHAMYADRATYAVLEPGERTQMIMKRGLQPGTAEGVAIRLLTQFKAFPIAMLEKTWGREINGGQGKLGALAGLTEFIVASTALGYLSMSVRDLLKGRQPRDPSNPQTFIAAMIAGGGFSIYGDFVFGQYSRFGTSLLANLAGPTLGQLDGIADIWGRLKSGDDAAAQAFRLATTNTPGMNVWYLRAGFDYALLYGIQESLNPGYLRRMESRLKRENNQEFLLKPSQTAVRY